MIYAQITNIQYAQNYNRARLNGNIFYAVWSKWFEAKFGKNNFLTDTTVNMAVYSFKIGPISAGTWFSPCSLAVADQPLFGRIPRRDPPATCIQGRTCTSLVHGLIVTTFIVISVFVSGETCRRLEVSSTIPQSRPIGRHPYIGPSSLYRPSDCRLDTCNPRRNTCTPLGFQLIQCVSSRRFKIDTWSVRNT